MAFDNIKLDKGLYCAGKNFTQALEAIDPGEQYRGTTLEGLDAYERQLKRFGIRVSGKSSDRVEQFFQSADTAVLFPEFVARTVERGMKDASKIDSVVAATTQIDGIDYRPIGCDSDPMIEVGEGDELPQATLQSRDWLVNVRKYGYVLNTTYESLRLHRIDVFGVMLRKIGADIAEGLLATAVDVLADGADTVPMGGALNYDALIRLWNAFGGFNMTTILAGAEAAQQILALPEMRDGCAGLDFHGSGNLVTPLGAELIRSDAVPAGRLVALDKNCALEMVRSGDITTDYERLIDRQFHRSGISLCAGFAKIFEDAALVMV